MITIGKEHGCDVAVALTPEEPGVMYKGPIPANVHLVAGPVIHAQLVAPEQLSTHSWSRLDVHLVAPPHGRLRRLDVQLVAQTYIYL